MESAYKDHDSYFLRRRLSITERITQRLKDLKIYCFGTYMKLRAKNIIFFFYGSTVLEGPWPPHI
jgi:hypothetical protein